MMMAYVAFTVNGRRITSLSSTDVAQSSTDGADGAPLPMLSVPIPCDQVLFPTLTLHNSNVPVSVCAHNDMYNGASPTHVVVARLTWRAPAPCVHVVHLTY